MTPRRGVSLWGSSLPSHDAGTEQSLRGVTFHFVTLPREQRETLTYLLSYTEGWGHKSSRRHTSTDKGQCLGANQSHSKVTRGWVGWAKRRGSAPCDGRCGARCAGHKGHRARWRACEARNHACDGRCGARCAGLRENYFRSLRGEK